MFRGIAGRRIRRLRVVLATTAAVVSTAAVVVSANAATPPHVPFGHFDSLMQTPDGIQVAGWALDPDSTAPIHVDVYVNGHGTRRLWAANPRPDVDRRFHKGADHGFTADIPEPPGTYSVCLYAINVGAGRVNPRLGCSSLTISNNPAATILTANQYPGGFTATGWAVDPNQPATALTVNLSVDGSLTSPMLANQPRTDIPAYVPAAGPNHGYTMKVTAPEGSHRVCVVAKNVGAGTDATTGCRTLTLNFSPVGAITNVVQRTGGFSISGWATDPDVGSAVTVDVYSDGTRLGSALANGAAAGHTGHGFSAGFQLPGAVPPGNHAICVVGRNLGTYGKDAQLACRSVYLNFNPTATALTVKQESPGARLTGWAKDPDTGSTVAVQITGDGKTLATVSANLPGATQSGYNFSGRITLPNGTHSVCAVAINRFYGSGDSPPSCLSVTLNFNPFGRFDSLGRSADGTSIVAGGWAIDPDTTGTIPIQVTVDGTVQTPTSSTGVSRPDVARRYPGTGTRQGFVATYKANAQEHKVCVTAVNVKGGSGNTSLGCRIINAVHPVVPTAPSAVTATPGYGTASVAWTPPASDGGAPWSSYTVTALPGGPSVTVGPGTTSTTVNGLKGGASYYFTVVATNVVGRSPAGTSGTVKIFVGPPPQTTPAPISTSRYIRNISAATSTDLARMRAWGAADANANPSGHAYLMLLDIGGQSGGGVVLSATTHWVSYPNLVADVKAYVDGYAGAQKATAPAVIAIGTNNDIDVSSASGAAWANSVVDPIRSYAAKYLGITIAGANDIEPGFRGTYTATKAWLGGYLGATSAKFVNNGSADGCAWTATNRACNNGWSMAGLYWLSAGASPARMITLPQIYNNTMAAQWKYISLTGVTQSNSRINFGGPLTEWTACTQAGSCGSLTGNAAWTQMWNQLQSDSRLRIPSLPYSTDLRIN